MVGVNVAVLDRGRLCQIAQPSNHREMEVITRRVLGHHQNLIHVQGLHVVPLERVHVESTDLGSVHRGRVQINRLYLDVRPDDCLVRCDCSHCVVRVVVVLCCSYCCIRLLSGPQFHLVVLDCPVSPTTFARV